MPSLNLIILTGWLFPTSDSESDAMQQYTSASLDNSMYYYTRSFVYQLDLWTILKQI